MESNLLIRINMIFKRTLSVSNWGAPFVTILVSSALGNYSNAWIVPFNCLIKSVLISSTGLNIFFFQINYIFKHLFFSVKRPNYILRTLFHKLTVWKWLFCFSVLHSTKKTRSSRRFMCSVLRRKHLNIDANFLSLLSLALQDKFTEYS